MGLPEIAQLRALSLDGLLRSKSHGFGLVSATSTQRAICRVIEGRPLGKLYTPEFATGIGPAPTSRPQEVVLLSGIRTAKSLTAAALAVHASQHCDLSRLKQSEVARVSIVSLTLDLANVVYSHLTGHILRSPVMRGVLCAEPRQKSVILRHPSGRIVEIKVVAGSRAGASLAARWSAGVIFDEAPKMLGSEEGVVNLDDARDNVIGRLLPNAQMISVGSPWAPYGPIYDLVQEHWKKPSERIAVMWYPAPQLNPVWWTPERCEKLKATDPDAYLTDVLAQFRSAETSMFDSVSLERCTRASADDIPPDSRSHYIARIDPATRGNAWTLVIGCKDGPKKRIVLARQWLGSRLEPLRPGEVFQEMAKLLQPYRVTTVHSDQWSEDSLREHAERAGLRLSASTWTTADAAKLYRRAQTDFQEGIVEIPNLPHLKDDLKRVKRRTTPTGFSIHLPTTQDGRHCDFAPPIVGVLTHWLADRDPLPETERERTQRELDEAEERAVQAVTKGKWQR